MKASYYCDNCRKHYDKNTLYKVAAAYNKSIQYLEFCNECISMIITKVIKEKLIDLQYECNQCKGKGVVKEFYGPHNDYNWEKCPKCQRR